MDTSKPPKKLPPVLLEDLDKVDKEVAAGLDKKWKDGLSKHQSRTNGFKLFGKVAHNMSLFEKVRKDEWSEGSTQTIMRKIRSQTLQRVPDGEIVTPFDKNSIEQATVDFLFKHKILTSEIDGKDMLKMLWKTFDSAYVYGFGCVRTGFERDLDGDPRVSYTVVPYADVVPSPDCKAIEEADWYIVREYLPMSSLKAILDCETGTVSDPTYEADVVRYIVEHELKDGADRESEPLADLKKDVTFSHSVEVRTYYCRGDEEFVTYVPDLNCVLRRVKNYDPRKDIPLHFLILEPDPEFPYGCSQVMWTMAQQQFADAFQSTAYQTLLLSLKPPLQVFGNLTNPKIKMKAGAIWPMGTNPNNRIEPYRVETTTLTGYNSILEGVSARMMASLNITDATVASDANVPHYSATPQGVEQQRLDKTITINQVQKRVEIFFSEWANHAIRSYIASMKGVHQITVDAKTRKRIESIEEYLQNTNALQDLKDGVPPEEHRKLPSIVDGIKVEIDFSMFDDAIFNFEVRSCSLIESEQETEKENIQEMLVAVSQMLGNVSDKNKESFEQVIMQLVTRMCELANIDISASISSTLNQNLVMQALESTMNMVASQQQQIGQMQQAMGMPPAIPPEAMGMPPEAAMPPEAMGGMPPEAMGGMPPETAMPPEVAAPPAEVGGLPPDAMATMGGGEMPPEEAMMM
jgi:hypothetical protein